ncbi:polysaccharide lyase family protein [Streptomyces lonegramiae]|uniref:rhamnogalacturonan endolyase n=1 Tax=Streptomyces lonegramiae TaxID=3075524 RepID=A0ABU2X7P1_9ACTN|nr:polysaccharide lyase family protein [Streptomyces sp. DSM 41529]MDT0541941.1 polysaccharide lyase family protein [Streptomyces sp. DSM 41529]
MLDRRRFHQFGVAAAIGAALPIAGNGITDGIAMADEALGVVETDTDITVDNGPVQLTVSKVSAARATSLKYLGQELLGSGGRGNFDMNNARVGDPLPLPPPQNTYEIRRGEDFVDIAFRYSPTNGGPFWLVRHHIVRAGEPGIHLATTFHHTAELHGFSSEQHRYVFYLDKELFTHASVEDDGIGGVAWRESAARMPTPEELKAATVVMDATYDLAGLGSAYPKRYYTKYDWGTYIKDHAVHGLYGKGFGIWAVTAHRDAFSGGPTRHDLTLHQTDSRPVLLVEPHGAHYGFPPVRVAAGQEWQKTYGPYYVHFNTGDDPAALRADALRYADEKAHAAFYDRVALPGWTPSTERATVHGRVVAQGESRLRGAVAVLSDNGVDMQRTALGYAYWTDTHADGGFTLRDVRPGTYRLTVYKPGVWGEYVRDDVVVPSGGTVRLGTLRWTPLRHGRTVFQIGTPDRTSVEYRRGPEYQQWGTWSFYPQDFPEGVVYRVGRSSPARDWNYLQFQQIDGVRQAPWRILFDLDEAPRAGRTATLTVALAAWSLDTARSVPSRPTHLAISVNDEKTVWRFEPDDSRGATYRSGCSGGYFRRIFSFDAAVLRRGENEITLTINEDTGPEMVNTAAYDAIRLELR